MSNDTNREPGRSITPSDLRASDFFPPGEGWNKDESIDSSNPASLRERAAQYEESARDGNRPH